MTFQKSYIKSVIAISSILSQRYFHPHPRSVSSKTRKRKKKVGWSRLSIHGGVRRYVLSMECCNLGLAGLQNKQFDYSTFLLHTKDHMSHMLLYNPLYPAYYSRSRLNSEAKPKREPDADEERCQLDPFRCEQSQSER